jgi:hypothetical protein
MMKWFSSIGFLLCTFFALESAYSQEAFNGTATGRTGLIYPGQYTVAGSSPAVMVSGKPSAIKTPFSNAGRQSVKFIPGLEDSLNTRISIPAGKYFAFKVSQAPAKILAGDPLEPLSAKAQQAIAKAPAWLREDLTDNFRRLKDLSVQDRYAQIILDAVDPYVDEIAFTIAHLPVQVLTHGSFDPAVITLNAQLIYQYDQMLDYVQIIDTGTSNDGDYSSTARYVIADTSGNTTTLDLPRDIYYWYLVHPKLSDELPAFINPDNGGVAARPVGMFWRDYLWTASDNGLPLLKDKLQGVNVAWCQRVNVDSISNGAVGMVTRWLKTVMKFGAGTERPIQPTRIYKVHRGNCGEWADMTSAASRIALIPCANSDDIGDDHTWNEFWLGRWTQWEPTNTFIDYPRSYENWGWVLGSVTNWRGDTYKWPVTSHYTPTCTLTATITDADGHPVDGARVSIAAHYHARDTNNIMISTYAYTDANGQAVFSLGDDKKLYIRVDSKLGSVPSSQNQVTQVIDASQAGAQYTWSTKLPGRLSLPAPQAPAAIYSPVNEYQIDASFTVAREISYGLNVHDAAGSEFSNVLTGGNIGVMIMDESNYVKYTTGREFSAEKYLLNSPSSSISHLFATRNDYYLVFTNEEKILDKQVVDIDLRLSKTGAPVVGTIAGTVTLEGRTDHAGASITTDTGDKGTSSAAGNFEINNVTAGRHIVTASYPGYKSKRIDTTVAQGSTTNIAFVLEGGLASPVSLHGSVAGTVVSLAWNAISESDLIGYNVYRQETPNIVPQNIQPLNSKPVYNTEYYDSSVVAGKTYYYCVTAVYSSGSSTGSNEVTFTIPSILEVFYDDGSAEGSIGIPGVVSAALAVRFTPSFYPAKVQAVKIFAQHMVNAVDVKCWTGQSSPSQVIGTPVRLASGTVPDHAWTTVDYSNNTAIVTSGDVYAGIVYLTTNTGENCDFYVGADTTFGGGTFSNRSWVYLSNGWHLLSSVNNGRYKWDFLIRIVLSGVTGVEEEIEIAPSNISLMQNYPNPFGRTTNIEFRISNEKREPVSLKVYDVLGREVLDLTSRLNSDYSITSNGIVTVAKSQLPGPGVYYYRLSTPAMSQTRSMVLTK